jgi:hypothetical protein
MKFVEKIKTHSMFNKQFFFFESRAVYETCGKMLESGLEHR